MRIRCRCLHLLVSMGVLLSPVGALPQNAQPRPPVHGDKAPVKQASPAATPQPPRDATSLDAILSAMYSAISGGAGEARNWDRFRALFWPGARLMAVTHSKQGKLGTRVFTVEDYISGATPAFATHGFFEREIGRHVDEYEHLTQVFSAYESCDVANKAPFERGINAIQLLNDGRRWWILQIVWEAETPDHPIPERYIRQN